MQFIVCIQIELSYISNANANEELKRAGVISDERFATMIPSAEYVKTAVSGLQILILSIT